MKVVFIFIFTLATLTSFSKPLTWEEGMPVPVNGFQNPYDLAPNELQDSVQRGRIHALKYPVEVTGLLIPYRPVKNFFDDSADGFLKRRVQNVFKKITKMNSLDDLMKWLGLHEFPEQQDPHPVYNIPYPDGVKPSYRMGFSLRETPHGLGFTISCAVCHSHNLFGKKIIGLTNRFPRANEFFVMGKRALAVAPSPLFKWGTGATKSEKKLYKKTKKNIKFVKAKKPELLGLDTSLAHVALSLARRAPDPYASKDRDHARNPRKEKLKKFPADSKPGVWWNVKYKNKWLLDGSVISGNPIFTNLLWNEIGRGTDLNELENWLHQNKNVVIDLTNAVFHNEAPRFTDFFEASHFKLNQVKKGEKIYNQLCSKCHGHYTKAWSSPDAKLLSLKEQLKTIDVILPEQTKVVHVGTDSHRFQGMDSLTQLNELNISQNNDIKIKKQKGYVPSPLVGIWARWPYMHNNSIPNLCTLLSPSSERPSTYWAGEANDKNRDFDRDCNGYPLGDKTPAEWKKNKEHFYNSLRPGLSNKGHDQRIFIKDGKNILTAADRRDLIQFLQTL